MGRVMYAGRVEVRRVRVSRRERIFINRSIINCV